MRPYQHSQSTAKRCGGSWQDYLAVHEFIDSSKASCADIRHRMILHSVDFGAALTEMAFPERDDTNDIVRGHVVEDLGAARTLSQWLQHCRKDKLPRLHPSSLPVDIDGLVAREVKFFGSHSRSAVHKVCTLLTMPTVFAPDFGPESLCILGNSFGPALVRRIFGPPTEVDGTIFDPALCAERIIFQLYRAIPPMTSVVHTLISSHQSVNKP